MSRFGLSVVAALYIIIVAFVYPGWRRIPWQQVLPVDTWRRYVPANEQPKQDVDIDPSKAVERATSMVTVETMPEGVTFAVRYVFFTADGTPFVLKNANLSQDIACGYFDRPCPSLIVKIGGKYIVSPRGIDKPGSTYFRNTGYPTVPNSAVRASMVAEKEEHK